MADTVKIGTKVCSRCGEEKPRAVFPLHRSNPDGLYAWCKPCKAEYGRRLFAEDGDYRQRQKALSVAARKVRRADPELRAKELAVDCARRAERVRTDPGFARKTRAWAMASYRRVMADPERRERFLAWVRQYIKRDHVRSRRVSATQRYRAQQRGNAAPEMFDRSEIFARDGGVCHICGGLVNPESWHVDHVVPLARGGEHSRTNVAVAHPFCNQSKGAKLI